MVTNNAMKYPEEPADKPKQLKTLSELNICIECLSKKHMLLHHKNESMANNESLGLSNKHWYEQVCDVIWSLFSFGIDRNKHLTL